ncbi:MAG: TIR domain-containing protein [Planctomycetes bacterium]|nr:TIR domain-containing protein [Planctomycetota bacterium]
MAKHFTEAYDAHAEALKRIEACRLEKWTNLDLSKLDLKTVPPEIGQLTALLTLELYSNQLTWLPPEIGQLKALKILHLGYNCFTVLPPQIGQLAALTHLFPHNNKLKALPPEIGQLTALTSLYLHDNQLISLPEEIGRLTELETLVLESNALREVPESMKDLTQLKVLTLHGNDALGLPTELLGPTWGKSGPRNPPANPRAILDFYFSRREQGDAAMREVRVLLIGRGRVGKTSLLRVLQNKQVNPTEPETPGITVEPLELKCPKGTAKAHVWDFGGQEFLHGTHQIFLSERCVYVLVLEGRESNWETETDYWLRFIQSFGGESPVIVALNKYDLHAFSVDRHRLKERCPQIVGFVQTDAITGRGVPELRGLLETTVDQMKDVWLGVPLKWHRMKESLQKMPESFLEYKDYAKMCVEHGVPKPGEQESLAGTLHRLGIALNFREHHRLKHTSVLKPEWVTEAIYGLIRFTQKQDCHGVLRSEWLPEALQPTANYPPDKHEFVVDLMAKFEVAFPLDDKGTLWLIPELLGEEQPEEFKQFLGANVQRLRFSYPDALPPGLLPRFIVRTHEMSDAHPQWRWRSGVVLEWAGCQALVRLDRLERRTEVAVLNCPLPDQQSLFDIIRAHLIVLHGNVRVIEESEIEGHRNAWVNVGKLRLKEQKGTKQIEEFIDEQNEAVVEVSKALDQVESDAATEAAGPDPQRRVHLFISYAHVNERELMPIRQHLTLLSQQGYIQVWHDRNLVAGEKWEVGIMEELTKAEIVLLFYTTGARVSTFIQEKELLMSLDRSDKKECTLIWVPLERNDLLDTHPLEKRLKALQCATRDAKKIYDFDQPQVGWMQVEDSIRRAVEKRRQM